MTLHQSTLEIGLHCTNPKSQLGLLRPVQQLGSYWDRSSALPLVGLEPTQR